MLEGKVVTDKDENLAEIALNFVRAANLLERLGGRYALEAELGSVQQYMILSLLRSGDSLSMGELRKSTLVTKQAVTGLVERMKKGGYVETYNDLTDRRITRVRLTTKGKEALKMIRPKRIAGNREAFSVLSEREISQLSVIIPKLISHLDNKSP